MEMKSRRSFSPRDERGMSLVFVGVGFMGFVAATILAVDVGMLMTARAQAQNSADAGAHAGAVALAFDSYTDRSPSGPAVVNAVQRATENPVMGVPVAVTPADVEFLPGPTGLVNRVKVTVYRTDARGNPLGLFIAPVFGIATADINATATAEASPANAMDCVLPFMLPDKWTERTDPPFLSDSSTFDVYKNKNGGELLANPDVYVPADQSGYTGYDPIDDRGSRLVLKTDNDSKVSPSIYNPIVLPGGGTGADDFRDAIAGCAQAEYVWGQPVTVEPGNMSGPTKQGIEDLVDKDPNAYWDEGCRCVRGSDYPVSPRVRPIPLYDPYFYETGKQSGRNADFKVANFLGVFVEGMQGNEVIAYITPITGTIASGGGPVPENAFPYAIRIVE